MILLVLRECGWGNSVGEEGVDMGKDAGPRDRSGTRKLGKVSERRRTARAQCFGAQLCCLPLLPPGMLALAPTAMPAPTLSHDGSQSTLQPWAGGAVVSAPILVSGGERFESSPLHFF